MSVEADVLVVGAGPAGSATATHLARRGLDVALLEKSQFPREKVCGDGLTPRATRQLIRLGIDTSVEAGWLHNKGLRIYGGSTTPFELPWPELADFPSYGLVRPRADFDDLLARNAVAAGAKLYERTNVSGPIIDDTTGRIVGVTTKNGDTFKAPLVVAADGNSTRLSLALGLTKRDDRPMGVAVRTYYRSPRHIDDHLESWLELWAGKPGESDLLPGYGWIFGMGDGTCNVGLGVLNTSSAFGKTDYKDVLRRWADSLGDRWELTHDPAGGPIRGAALPIGFNRAPLYADGLLLVGDAAGMVNPFNGEGIDYALEAARVGSEVIAQALARPSDAGRERALAAYPRIMKSDLGGYFTLGRWFARAIGNPEVMRLATTYGLPRTALMRFLLKVMANLPEEHGGRLDDRLVHLMSRVVPDA